MNTIYVELKTLSAWHKLALLRNYHVESTDDGYNARNSSNTLIGEWCTNERAGWLA